jgi:hypothetical protein
MNDSGFYFFPMGPGATTEDGVMNALWRAHDQEAQRLRAEFYNYGACTDDTFILSKTSRGYLETSVNPRTKEVSHRLTPYCR